MRGDEDMADQPHNSNFPAYFVARLLKDAGWPQKRGVLRSRYMVNSGLVKGAVKVLFRTGVGIGAGLPEDAIKLVADLFSLRDWKSQSATQLFAKADIHQRLSQSGLKAWDFISEPWMVLQPAHLPLRQRLQHEIP